MGVIYLVRHGQAGAGMGGVGSLDDGAVEKHYDGLTARGRRQAEVVARSLVERIGRPGEAAAPTVFCGPLHRQHDTALAVASALGAGAPVSDPAWKEFDSDTVVVPWLRRNPGTARRLQGVMQDARRGAAGAAGAEVGAGVESVVGEVLDGALGEWVEGTGFREFRETVLGGLDRATAAARSDGAVVVATSAGVVATCIAAVSGLPHQTVPSLVGKVFNASVTVLRVADDAGHHRGGGAGVDLLSFNEHAHLDRADARGDLTVI